MHTPSANPQPRRRVSRALLAVALLPLLSLPLGAQGFPGEEEDGDPNASAAYFALITTPVGALPPSIATGALGLTPNRMGVRAQFGNVDLEGDVSIRTFGGTLDVPVGRATVGLTAAYLDVACDTEGFSGFGVDLECQGSIMGGASLSYPVLSVPMGASASFALGVDAAAGMGSGDLLEMTFDDGTGEMSMKIGGTSLSGSIVVPVAFVARSPSVVFVPHLRPGIGYGRSTLRFEATGEEDQEGTESGTRFMLGGGLGVLFPTYRLGVDLGFQKIFIEDGKTMVGVGLTFGR